MNAALSGVRRSFVAGFWHRFPAVIGVGRIAKDRRSFQNSATVLS